MAIRSAHEAVLLLLLEVKTEPHRSLESSIHTLTAEMLIKFNVVAAYQR
jgi:hypothetical protein